MTRRPYRCPFAIFVSFLALGGLSREAFMCHAPSLDFFIADSLFFAALVIGFMQREALHFVRGPRLESSCIFVYRFWFEFLVAQDVHPLCLGRTPFIETVTRRCFRLVENFFLSVAPEGLTGEHRSGTESAPCVSSAFLISFHLSSMQSYFAHGARASCFLSRTTAPYI